jgi:hypothetical protein
MSHMLTPTGAFRAWWSVLMVLAAAIAVGTACVVYTQHMQHQADRRWCDLLSTLDQPQAPPTTDRGLVIQRKLHHLRGDLGCGG